jgi:hypothetical protein
VLPPTWILGSLWLSRPRQNAVLIAPFKEALVLPQWKDDSPEWEKLEARRKELQKQREDVRSDLSNACRRNLGLWRTLPTLPERSVGPSDEEIVLHDMKRKRQDREHPSKQTAGT